MKNQLKVLLLACATSMATPAMADESRMIFVKEIWGQHQTNPLAQFYIAEQHYLQKDYSEALSWYLRAAMQSHVSASNNVMLMIENNQGVASNMDDVVAFMIQSGLKGDMYSQMYLGDIHRDERFETNYESAYFWYSQAASQGDSAAQYYIGNMTLAGLGTPKNVPKALRFLEDLAEKGHAGAMYNIGKVYKTGFNILKNHKLASKWFHMAAKEGHVDSMYEIADSFERGFGLDKSERDALEWFETAALHGHTDAAYRAGLLNLFFAESDSKLYSVEKAMDWLILASENNNADAQMKLGDIYYEGKFGLEIDYKQALEWYKRASHDDKFAAKKMSMIYRAGGYGVERDDDAYKAAMKSFYEYRGGSMAKPQEKLKLFNYNIFEF
jgi:TPR repeat protein